MSEQSATFLDRCLNGDAVPDEIDDYVDRWHEGGGFGVSLADYIGLTFEEYARWVEQPDALDAIVFARKNGSRPPTFPNGQAGMR